MTADREVLREAVLKVLPIDPERGDTLIRFDVPEVLWQKYTPAPVYGDPNVLADAIVDAVLAAEYTKHEWAYRYPNGHVATLPAALLTEEVVRAAVAEHPDLLTAVRRRVGEWEDA